MGIPFMYFVLLIRKRSKLDPGQVKLVHELGSEKEGRKKGIVKRVRLIEDDQSLASLSMAYEPQ